MFVLALATPLPATQETVRDWFGGSIGRSSTSVADENTLDWFNGPHCVDGMTPPPSPSGEYS